MPHHLRCWKLLQFLTLLAFAAGSILEPELGLLRDGALHAAEHASPTGSALATADPGAVPPADSGQLPSAPHQHGGLADHCGHSHILTSMNPFRFELYGAEFAPRDDAEAQAVVRSSPPLLHPPRA